MDIAVRDRERYEQYKRLGHPPWQQTEAGTKALRQASADTDMVLVEGVPG